MFRLGIKLKLKHNKVVEIRNHLNITSYDKIFEILVTWREKFGQQADINQVIAILKDMDKNSIVDEIEAKLESSR